MVFNANVMADGAALAKNYAMSRSYTYEEAGHSGQTVQGDPMAAERVIENRALLHVRNADGNVERIPLMPSDFTVAWHATNAGNERHIMLIPEGHRALFPKADWGSVERLEAPGAVVATVPDLAARGEIPTLSSTDIACMAYTAQQLRELPEAQPEGQKTPVVTKALIRDAVARLLADDKQAVGNWLNLIGAQDFPAQMGLNPVSLRRGPASDAKPAP